jgi:hypothetical protein
MTREEEERGGLSVQAWDVYSRRVALHTLSLRLDGMHQISCEALRACRV